MDVCESFTDPVHKAGEITALVCIVYALLVVFLVILPKMKTKKATETEVKALVVTERTN